MWPHTAQAIGLIIPNSEEPWSRCELFLTCCATNWGHKPSCGDDFKPVIVTQPMPLFSSTMGWILFAKIYGHFHLGGVRDKTRGGLPWFFTPSMTLSWTIYPTHPANNNLFHHDPHTCWLHLLITSFPLPYKIAAPRAPLTLICLRCLD